jgi:hypothetical protein
VLSPDGQSASKENNATAQITQGRAVRAQAPRKVCAHFEGNAAQVGESAV